MRMAAWSWSHSTKAAIVPPNWTYTTSLSGYNLAPGIGHCWIMDQVSPELNSILQEIEHALAAKLYYLAIAVTLSVPDICACLENDPDKPEWAERKTYTRWCKDNLDTKFKNITGNDLYNIRGGVVHRGHFDHDKSRFDRIMFIGPESRIKAHDIIVTVAPGVQFGGRDAAELRLSGDILQLDVMQFCQTVMAAARSWSIAKRDDPFVKRNLTNLVRYRPNGLPPF